MITLQYSKYTAEIEFLESRLKEMALTYKIEQVKALPQPNFDDGTTRVEGIKNIKEQLNQLEGELKDWWYCSC